MTNAPIDNSSSSSVVQNFFSGLRNLLDNSGNLAGTLAENNLFSHLLSSSSAALDNQAANATPSHSPATHLAQKFSSSSQTDSNTDNSDLTSLLQRIRSDYQQLRQMQQAKTGAKSPIVKPDDQAVVANVKAADTVTPVAASPTNDAAPVMATIKKSDDATSKQDSTQATTSEKSLLADLADAEKAVLVILQQQAQPQQTQKAISADMADADVAPTDQTAALAGTQPVVGQFIADAAKRAGLVGGKFTAAAAVKDSTAADVAGEASAKPDAVAPKILADALASGNLAKDTKINTDELTATQAATPVAANNAQPVATAAPVTNNNPINLLAEAIAAATSGNGANAHNNPQTEQNAEQNLLAARNVAADQANNGNVANATNSHLGLVAETSGKTNPYNFASQLSALRSSQTSGAVLASPAEQVALFLNKQVKSGNDQITMQLQPAELGRIEVKLQFNSDNKVQGMVLADNQSTLDMLKQDQGSLQRALQDAGLQADAGSLQFGLRDGNQAAFQQQFNDQKSGANVADQSLGSNANTTVDVMPAELYYITPGGVNVRI